MSSFPVGGDAPAVSVGPVAVAGEDQRPGRPLGDQLVAPSMVGPIARLSESCWVDQAAHWAASAENFVIVDSGAVDPEAAPAG